MKKLYQLLAVVLTTLLINTSFAKEDPTPVEIGVIKALKKLEHVIADSVSDFAGQSIPNYKKPSVLLDVVKRSTYVLDQLPKTSKVATDLVVGRLYMTAFMTLLGGRGEKEPMDGIYWYLNNKGGETGYFEILELIEMGKFDKVMKNAIKTQLKRIKVKEFKPRGSIQKSEKKFISSSILDDLVEAIEHSDTASNYTNLYGHILPNDNMSAPSKSISAKAVREAAKLKKNKPTKSMEYHRNLPVRKSTYDEIVKRAGAFNNIDIKANYYDRAVEIHNSDSKKFPQYFGRDNDVNRILDVLARPNKSHVVLTSKLGVDKDSVMQMLQDGFIKGSYQIADEAPPLVLSINPSFLMMQGGPESIHNKLSVLSKATKRRVVAYVDEAQIAPKVNKESLKSFLGDMVHNDHNIRVNYILATTSADSRKLLDDDSLSAKLEEINIAELSKSDSVSVIKENFIPMWKKHYRVGESSFIGLNDDALEFAARNFKVENPNTVRAKAMTELLEGAIARKQRLLNESGAGGSFQISIDDIRDYFSEKFDEDLIPGSKRFNTAFDERWTKFNSSYFGNSGLKDELKEFLYLHFADPEKKQMSSTVVFGAPGGGKSYGAAEVAGAYFNGALLELNGADFKSISDVNKIQGSPPGYIGSEEQRSVFTKFIKENPNGGIILLEEADYVHPNVMELFTNMITSKEFRDGLGKSYDMSKYVLWLNSNIGQEYMIPTDAKNKMNWSQYNVRLNQLTQDKVVDGEIVKIVRKDKKSQMMNKFMAAIVNNGRIGGSSNNEIDEAVSQAAQKQSRRYTPLYALPPSQEDLRQATQLQYLKYKTKLMLDYEIDLEVSESTLREIVDLEKMEFEKGYSYVAERLETFLFNKVNFHKSQQGAKIVAEVKQIKAASPVDNKNTLLLSIDKNKVKYDLGNMLPAFDNQWAKSSEIKENIKQFPARVKKYLKGDGTLALEVQSLLKRHAIDWKSRPVITLVGTTGNGKTQFAKAAAKALFDDSSAYMEVPTTGVDEFNAFLNGQDFKNWVESRIRSGGGVIGFDELLSIQGNPEMKLYMFNKLYKFLDEGFMTINGKEYDMRAFVPVLTGNAMQEMFEAVPDNPDGELMTDRIIKDLKSKDVVDYFKNFGFDAPKIARMGLVKVKGPLKKNTAYEVGSFLLEDSLDSILKDSGIFVDVVVDAKIINKTVDMFSTITLGMRDVKKKGLEKLVLDPIGAILVDIENVRNLEMKLGTNDELRWYANGKRIVLEDKDGRTWQYLSEAKKDGVVKDFTVQLNDIKPKKKEMTRAAKELTRIHEVEGHWMAEYLLTGKNGAQSINLIPGGNYLGYMMPKQKDKIGIHSLVTEMKDVIVLEAGHRSVFYHGYYEYGGGSNGKARDPQGRARDDLGRVDETLQRFLSNNLFEDYSEFSKSNDIHLFKDTLRMVAKYATDNVIEYGNANGVSEGINGEFTRKIAEGRDEFLNEQEIESFVKKFEESNTLRNHNELFYESIVKGIKKYIEREDFMDEKPLKKLKLLKDLAYQIGMELRSSSKSLNTGSKVYEGFKEIESLVSATREKALKLSKKSSSKKNGDCNNLF